MHNKINNVERSRSLKTMLSAVAVGAAVGATLAVLFAPKRGREVRRQLAETSRRLSRRASSTIATASASVNDVMEGTRRAFEAGRSAYSTRAAEASPKPAAVRTTPRMPVS